MARFPGFVFSKGVEPDPRFSMANERTFLAWIRTALALVATGVALQALAVDIEPGLRLAAAIIFIALGVISAVQAWVGWARSELALRMQRALPPPAIGILISVGVVAAVALIAIGFFV